MECTGPPPLHHPPLPILPTFSLSAGTLMMVLRAGLPVLPGNLHIQGCHLQERSTLSSLGIPRWLSTTCKQTASLIIQCLTMCAHELTTSTAFGYPSKCILLVFACVIVVIYCLKEFLLFMLELRLCPLDFFFPLLVKGDQCRGKLSKHYNECCCCRSLCMSVLQCPVAPLTAVQNTCFNIGGVAICKNVRQLPRYWLVCKANIIGWQKIRP